MSFENEALLEQVPHLRRFAISLLRNGDRADDLVQDCLVRALSKRNSFEAGTNLRSWLFTIQRNLFIDDHRRDGNRSVAIAADYATDRAEVKPGQEDRLLLNELEAAIVGLPSAHRHVLLLVTMQGYSYQEAATLTKVPVGTVRSRVSRARGVLREKLQLDHSDQTIYVNEGRQDPVQQRQSECLA